MTAATLAGISWVAQASMIACKLVPLPLINTTSRQSSDGLTNDDTLLTYPDFTKQKDFLSEFF